jgi:cytochrome P450
MNLNFKLGTHDFKKEAYEIYDYLREHDPIHEMTMNSGDQAWLITKYDDAIQVLKNDERFTKDFNSLVATGDYKPYLPPKVMNLLGKQMLSQDPPNHSRLRSIVAKTFTPRMVEAMEGSIQSIADHLIDEFVGIGNMELINDYAFSLPIYVICNMLGIPIEDQHRFKDWSHQFINSMNDRDKMKKTIPALENFADYIEELMQKRKNAPTNDLISQLINAQEEADRLSAIEVSSMVFLILMAGHETTVNLLGNGVLALLENPEQMKWLQEHPEAIATAVEELLRFHSPVELTTNRWARSDFEWNGKQISKGDLVYVSLASANRDPEHFEEPGKLDLARSKNKHIAFGTGIHFCLGAPLARMEGIIAISTLLKRMPDLHCQIPLDELEWRSSTLMRGLVSLPVAFRTI